MKIYITQQSDKYTIFRVSDHLVEEFKIEMGQKILVEANSIQEAIIKFSELKNKADFEFDSNLVKYKQTVEKKTRPESDHLEERVIKNRF